MEMIVLIVFLFSAISMINVPVSEGFPFSVMQVSIGNRLGGGRDLGIHCSSGEEDLGFHTLANRDTMAWTFRVNPWGATSFYCDVSLPDNSAHRKHFYAYSYQRDSNRCWLECDWIIQSDGRLYGRNPASGSWDYVPYEE